MTRLVVTGVSGCAGHAYLREVESLARLNGLNSDEFKVYNMGDYLKKAKEMCGDRTPFSNILYNQKAKGYLLSAYLMVQRDLEIREEQAEKKGKKIHSIIKTHTNFLLEGEFKPSGSGDFLTLIEPDRYATIVNTPKNVFDTWRRNPRSYDQWLARGLNLEDIIKWQSAEALMTQDWANSQHPHLTIPRNQPAETLLKYLLFPNMPVMYASCPMTNLKEVDASHERIIQLTRFNRKRFIVIDPWTIEVIDPRSDEAKKLPKVVLDADKKWTIERDRRWSSEEATIVLAYRVEDVHSSGMTDEQKEAIIAGNHSWAIGIDKDASPFTTGNVHPDKLFADFKEYINFIVPRYQIFPLKRFDNGKPKAELPFLWPSVRPFTDRKK